jgi:hypothetical protein
MFGKKLVKKDYDRETQKPIIHCSICNGEKVAGFKNLQTGKFEEVMVIKTDKDLQDFMEMYGVSDIAKEY